MLEEALVAYLKSCSGLSSLISSRIYPLTVPQDSTLPAASYQVISTDREPAFVQDTESASKMVQISSWATTLKKAKETAEQVRLALQNYSGMMGGDNGVQVEAVLIENELDNYDEPSKSYVVHQEYQIWYQEV